MVSAFWRKKLETIASWSLSELESFWTILISKFMVLKSVSMNK